ncbi:major capsid protein [Luteolibacter arcticus]|uniref:Major capsid protein n=1 Tax=Luteolibacter arcticus TaxID=1581411 RepID=A0ABT3GRX9_9BACT|nr:major capsid protein [Luteolibacter arcticus]MCW1926284.1 major capsid protein [Luteolibacter arcticus]
MATPANINTLNQFAKGLFQATASPLADFLAPVVITGAAQFNVIDYAKRSGFQVPSAKRAIGGDSTAVVTDGERVSITLQPYALHDIIDNHELALATTGEGSRLLREARVQNLVSQASNSRLYETLVTLRAGVSPTAEVWGGSDDPVADIDSYMKAVADATGLLPNRVVFALGAWSIFKNHAKVIDRYPGATTVAPMIAEVGSLFLNPNTECMVSTTVFDTKLNTTSSKSNALTATNPEVWIYYAAENANSFDASAFKTFRVQANPFGGVRIKEKDFGEKVITEWTEAAYVNNASAVARLTITTT